MEKTEEFQIYDEKPEMFFKLEVCCLRKFRASKPEKF